jgi:hypothetical protein
MDRYAIDLVPSCMVKDKKDIDFVVIGVRGERMLEMWESPAKLAFAGRRLESTAWMINAQANLVSQTNVGEIALQMSSVRRETTSEFYSCHSPVRAYPDRVLGATGSSAVCKSYYFEYSARIAAKAHRERSRKYRAATRTESGARSGGNSCQFGCGRNSSRIG